MAAAAFAFTRYHDYTHEPDGEPSRPSAPAVPELREDDKTVTHKFVETARHHPLVKSLRRSVGMTEIEKGDWVFQGSAILLDRKGTLALTAHQVDNNVMKVRFLPHPHHALHYCDTRAVLIAVDKATDTSYWRLVNPAIIDAFGLQPIQWGHIGNGEHHSGETVLSMGFPGSGEGELDAALHKIEDYAPQITVNDERLLDNGDTEKFLHPIKCKIEMTGTVGAGNSGGGVFDDVTGCFLGIVTSGSFWDSQFTPADAIWNGYVNLVPAARAGHLAPLQQQHKECDIHGATHAHTGAAPQITYH